MVLQLRKQIEQSLNKSGVSGYGAGMIYFIFYISKVYY
jgi:secreted protein with Ig-like and vWFA domain